MTNDAAIAFKLLVNYIRDEYSRNKDDQDSLPWKDMPAYAGCQIALNVYDDIYKKCLELSDKFHLENYDLLAEDNND